MPDWVKTLKVGLGLIRLKAASALLQYPIPRRARRDTRSATVKTGRTYFQLFGVGNDSDPAVRVFRPARAAPQEKSDDSQKETPQKETAQYVGADTCKTCHEDYVQKELKTLHFKTTLQDGHGESRHGPGSAHVEGGGDVTKIIGQVDIEAGRQRPLLELSR